MPPVKRERRGSPSPSGDPSDMQEQGSLQGSQNPSGPSARRRRVEDPSPSPSPPGGPGGGEGPSASRSNHLSGTNAASYQEDGDWDLKHEKLDKASDMTDRLGHKIRENFKFFIRTFQSPRQVVDMKKKKGEDSDSEEDDDKRDDEKMEYTYVERVKQMVTKGKRTLIVDFRHLYGKPECANLAWWLSQFPAKVLPLLNEAVSKLCVEEYKAHGRDKDEEVWVSISSFPCSDSIRKFRNEHLNNFVTCEAVITRRTQVFNQLQNLYLTCDQCGEINGPFSAVGAESDPFKNRTCSNPDCQSRFGFTVNAERTTYQNYQRVTLQEPPGSVLAGRMPRSKDAILSGELVDTVKPGDMVQVTGIYQAQYDVELNAQTSFPVFKTEILVNHVENMHVEKMLALTTDEIQELKNLSEETDIKDRLIQSLAPSIHGEPHIKTAVALAMFGAVSKIAPGGHRIRGDLNILILGDPGMAKSQFLKYVEKTMPRAVYTTGKGASGVGLTAAVGRDPVSGEWVLEGGAMVLADQGICLIDEFDKMNDQDRTSIHEAMEQQTISIAKAGICASLQARCSVIAAANPRQGRYDPQLNFAQNVDLTDPILSRFDVLCVLKDVPDTGRDVALADFVICSHIRSHPDCDEQTKKNLKSKGSGFRSTIEPLEQNKLRNYIMYARQNVKPTVSDLDRDKLARFYQEIRREAAGNNANGTVMTVRHVESMVRMAEAFAKMELRHQVNKRDVDNAIATMLESFCQTQKHAYAQELRKKFGHYIVQVQDHHQQLNGLLSRQLTRAELLIKDEQTRVAHVKEADFVKEAKLYLLQDSVKDYLKSDLFRESFVIDENLGGIRRMTEEERYQQDDFSLPAFITPNR